MHGETLKIFKMLNYTYMFVYRTSVTHSFRQIYACFLDCNIPSFLATEGFRRL